MHYISKHDKIEAKQQQFRDLFKIWPSLYPGVLWHVLHTFLTYFSIETGDETLQDKKIFWLNNFHSTEKDLHF